MRVVAELRIRLHENGALSVAGPVEDTAWCLAALEHARDAVNRHKSNRPEIVIPGGDVDAGVCRRLVE